MAQQRPPHRFFNRRRGRPRHLDNDAPHPKGEGTAVEHFFIFSKRIRKYRHPDFPDRLNEILPLPLGEDRGEGNGNNQVRNLSSFKRTDDDAPHRDPKNSETPPDTVPRDPKNSEDAYNTVPRDPRNSENDQKCVARDAFDSERSKNSVPRDPKSSVGYLNSVSRLSGNTFWQ